MAEDKAGGGLWLPGWISGGSATQSKILGAGFINALLSYHSRFHQFKIRCVCKMPHLTDTRVVQLRKVFRALMNS